MPKLSHFGLEWVRHDSPWTHTLGKWSHAPRDHFLISLRPRHIMCYYKKVRASPWGLITQVCISQLFLNWPVAALANAARLDIKYSIPT